MAVRLRPPADADLDDAYRRLKGLHGVAFSWDPPDVAGLERASATRLREYVRAWINEWDLVRLDPTYRPATEWLAVEPSYAEDPDLDREVGSG